MKVALNYKHTEKTFDFPDEKRSKLPGNETFGENLSFILLHQYNYTNELSWVPGYTL